MILEHAPRPSACVFDAYGTLLDLNSATAAKTAVLGERAAELAALWRRKQLEYSWLRSLMRRHVDFRQVTADALDHSLAALGLQDEDLRGRLMAAYERLTPYPEVAGMLAGLKRHGIRTAVLSNGSSDMLQASTAAAGLADLLDLVLSVEAVGVYKPAPEVYHLATTRLGVSAGEIAFFSSNGWDVHGAASFGFRVIWVNRAGLPDDRLPGTAAAVVPDLAGVADLLGLAGSGSRTIS